MPSPSTIQINRAEINRSNSQHSTGPRTESGKQRSSQNALRHGLTARSAVTPSEDPAAYQQHCRQFMDEYQPATPTETQLVQQLADTSWRINRIPLLEADVLARAQSPAPSPEPPTFDIVDAHRLLANLTLNSTRLARQFQKTLDQLRNIQLERLERQHCELKDAAAILELNKYEGVPWEPSDHGFVFSKDQVERFAQRMIRQNQSHHIAYARFQMPYRPIPSSELQPSAEAMTHLEKTTAHHSQPQAPSPPRSATASH
jgi:hypothetical protein